MAPAAATFRSSAERHPAYPLAGEAHWDEWRQLPDGRRLSGGAAMPVHRTIVRMNMVLAHPGIQPIRLGRSHGFTLIELMVSIVVMAVLLVVAVPNLAGFVRTSKVRAAQSELAAAMQLARSEATKRGVSIGITATAPVVGNELGGGWKVWVDVNDDGVLSANDIIVRDYPGYAGAVVLGVTAGALPVIFRPTGFATGSIGFKVCGKSDTTKGYTVVLQRVGMADVTEGVACP